MADEELAKLLGGAAEALNYDPESGQALEWEGSEDDDWEVLSVRWEQGRVWQGTLAVSNRNHRPGFSSP